MLWPLSQAVLNIIKSREVKVLVVLDSMFLHGLVRKVLMANIAVKPRYRRRIAVSGTKLSIKGVHIHVWTIMDVDSGGAAGFRSLLQREMTKRPSIPQEDFENEYKQASSHS
jgi:hypothetical protein